MYPPHVKRSFCGRLGDSWRDLSDELGIAHYERDRFPRGDEARAIWEWLADRDRTADLQTALTAVDRPDLAALISTGSAGLTNVPTWMKSTVRRRKKATLEKVPPPWRRFMVWSGSVATASVLIVVSSLSGLFGASVEHVVNAGADAVIGGDPIRVSMFIDTAEHTGNRTLMLPRPLSDTGTDIAALESLAGNGVDIAPFRDWVRAQAGGEPEHSFVKLVVEGRRRFTTVRIIDIKADIVKRGEPLKGTLFYDFYDGADPLTRIGFNLDENVPVAREIGDDGLGDPYFQTKATITLTYGEVEVFEITAGTAEHYVEWCIDLSLLIDGQSETVTVCPPDGQPMRTTAYHEPANKADSQFSAYQEMYRWWSSPLFRKVNPQTAGSHSD